MREFITRRRLLDQARRLLTQYHLVIAAPAGYGKTVFLQQLSQEMPETQVVKLTPAETDLAALQAHLNPFLDHAETVILDDLQVIADGDETLAWLTDQLDQLRPRYVLAGRTIPLDVDLLTMTGCVAVFDEPQMAFSTAESQVLLADAKPGEVATWYESLSGWPLGLGLLRQLPPHERNLPVVQQQLFAYLAKAVFRRLPDYLQQFLQVTAVPLHFHQALVQELWPEPGDALKLLDSVHQQNLFIQPDGRGQWRYHDLWRAFLQQWMSERTPEEYQQLARQTVDWYLVQDDLEEAIEQAIDAHLYDRAAHLIDGIPLSLIYDQSRYHTFRRWAFALATDVLHGHPKVVYMLGHFTSFIVGLETEAAHYLTLAATLADHQGDKEIFYQASIFKLGNQMQNQGATEAIIADLRQLLAAPECQGKNRIYGARALGNALSACARFRAAQQQYQEAVNLARQLENQEPALDCLRVQAGNTLVPLGKFAEVVDVYQQLLGHFATSPSWCVELLSNSLDLWFSSGNWSQMADTLAQITEKMTQLDTIEGNVITWQPWYEAVYAISQSDFPAAMRSLAEFERWLNDHTLTHVCYDLAHCWLMRRQGDWQAAREHAVPWLGKQVDEPFYQSLLALEHDIALGLASLHDDSVSFALQPETMCLIAYGARSELVRLRALLAVVCHHRGNARWRRHLHAARASVQRYPYYDLLLTQRDPDLGVYFWRIGLLEGLFVGDTEAALVAIGQIEPLVPLLERDEDVVVERTAGVLAQIGNERAMPPLADALTRRPNPSVEQALLSLEQTPPPPLHVQLMGNFRLQRNETVIEGEDFHRPIVLRLFHYFALRRGQAIPRDRILDDLWPDTAPDKAWTTFRTVYSRLRKILEPHMRPKAPNRYVALEGDAYRFDPLDVVTIDIEQFENIVRSALTADEANAVSSELTEQLTNYQPLLPDLAYADWLLDTRQRLDDLYVEGCLCLSQRFLAQGHSADAGAWAQRVVDVAPWYEEAYQMLIRSYARQGNRTLALKTYDRAVANLHAELDITPSSLTNWLYERLQRGDSI
ncbi:hypothetical protein KFU94_39205 [Chloroflexi bacterium TSY]|nr:hypothetical protein [Chloroflexi bacterium TSY]